MKAGSISSGSTSSKTSLIWVSLGIELDVKEGLQVVGMGLVFETPLELHQRGFLEVHHGKAAHHDIMDDMTRLLRVPAVSYTAEHPR